MSGKALPVFFALLLTACVAHTDSSRDDDTVTLLVDADIHLPVTIYLDGRRIATVTQYSECIKLRFAGIGPQVISVARLAERSVDLPPEYLRTYPGWYLNLGSHIRLGHLYLLPSKVCEV